MDELNEKLKEHEKATLGTYSDINMPHPKSPSAQQTYKVNREPRKASSRHLHDEERLRLKREKEGKMQPEKKMKPLEQKKHLEPLKPKKPIKE
jgi:hypothetical protein